MSEKNIDFEAKYQKNNIGKKENQSATAVVRYDAALLKWTEMKFENSTVTWNLTISQENF